MCSQNAGNAISEIQILKICQGNLLGDPSRKLMSSGHTRVVAVILVVMMAVVLMLMILMLLVLILMLVVMMMVMVLTTMATMIMIW